MAQWSRIHLPMQTWVQSLGGEDPLEEEMATLSSILENPMDGGAWRAKVHGVARVDTTEHRHTHTQEHLIPLSWIQSYSHSSFHQFERYIREQFILSVVI